jgi:hypothetical protein
MDMLPNPPSPEAEATIAAARIMADATLRAAWVQAGAAAGAIAAGAMAYLGAVRQVRLQERALEARALAYRFRLSKVVDEYLAKVSVARAAARRQLEAFQDNQTSAPITSFALEQPQMLHDENWEVHALLGPRAVELILAIDEAGLRLAQFNQEIRKDDVRTGAHFASGSLEPQAKDSDEPMTYEPKRAIVDYVEALDDLHRALVELQKELARVPIASTWRRLWLLSTRTWPHRRRRMNVTRIGGRFPALVWPLHRTRKQG